MGALRPVLSSPLRSVLRGPFGGSEAEIITADTLPVLAALTDAQTPADAFTSGEYSSSAGTISSETAVYYVDGAPQLGTYDLAAGEVVRVREDVEDSEGNTRSFWTAAVVVVPAVGSATFSMAGAATASFVASSTAAVTFSMEGSGTFSPVSGGSASSTFAMAGTSTVNFVGSAADATAPVFSAAWDAENNEIDLTITEVNFPVTIRWQIRAIATAAPDEAAMLAGTGAILNGSYSAASTPDSEVIDVSSLSDATDYTLYVMASDPSSNHSAISDSDFTYTAPTGVTVTMAGAATVSFVGSSSTAPAFAMPGSATVSFVASSIAATSVSMAGAGVFSPVSATAGAWMTGLAVIDGGTSATTSNAAVDGGTASTTTNDLIDCGLAA